MQPKSRKWLDDMQTAASLIAAFSKDRDVTEFHNDAMLRSAIYFQFMIVGEALTQLRNFEPDVADKISEAWRIIGFRNQIIHGYQKVDDEITWRIIVSKLPILQKELELLLK